MSAPMPPIAGELDHALVLREVPVTWRAVS
jgi:hypothetical protein